MNQLCDELLLIEISGSNKSFLFGVFYRPPSGNAESLHALPAISFKFPIILCGDFNVSNIDWELVSPTVFTPVTNSMCEFVRDNFLLQLVSDPTRHNNIIDLVFTNSPDLVVGLEVVDNLPFTDHDAVHFNLTIISTPQEPCSRSLYNYKKADLVLLNETLSHIPWNIIEQCDTIEESWMLFKDLFFGAVDIAVPRLKWRRKKLKHWFSYDTVHLIRQKRRLYCKIKSMSSPSQYLLSKYKRVSNQVRNNTRMDTKQFTESLCKNYSKDTRKFWNWVNSSKGHHNPIPAITDHDTTITDDTKKAEVFNKYFYSVFTKENMSHFDSLKSSVKFSPSLIDSVEFSPAIVYEHLCNIDASKACGPDLLPGFLLKHCAEFIAGPLAYLFSLSMRTGNLPQDWVTGNVVPVFKRNQRNLVSNYRPISLTSLVVKTME